MVARVLTFDFPGGIPPEVGSFTGRDFLACNAFGDWETEISLGV